MPRKAANRRNAKRRLTGLLEDVEQEAVEDFVSSSCLETNDRCSQLLYELLVDQSLTATRVEERIRHSPPAVAGKLALALQRAQYRQLSHYRNRLRIMASRLNSTVSWHFLEETLDEAIVFGLEQELRALVFEASGRFADPRMLRVGLRYYRFAPR